MADISLELKNIAEAEAGEDVRWSIHDGIKKINEGTMEDNAKNKQDLATIANEGIEKVTKIAQEAKDSSDNAIAVAESAVQTSESAKTSALAAVSEAKEAKDIAQEAKDIAEGAGSSDQALETANQALETANQALETANNINIVLPFDPNNVFNKNNMYGGRNRGTAIGEDDLASIKEGTFNDMLIGDYWEIGETKAYIASFNPKSKSIFCVLINANWSSKFSESNPSTLGYKNSTLWYFANDIFNELPLEFKSNFINIDRYVINSCDINGRKGYVFNQGLLYPLCLGDVFGYGLIPNNVIIIDNAIPGTLPLFRLGGHVLLEKQSWFLDVYNQSLSYGLEVNNGERISLFLHPVNYVKNVPFLCRIG